jgi:hypothetical protein
MRQAGAEYLQEETRYRGARPRVRAAIFPYALDYGLAPGSGEFVNTEYGGEPGKVALQSGYITEGSWVSPVMHTFSPNLNRIVPIWQDGAGYLETWVYLRSGATPAEALAASFLPLTSGQAAAIGPYFQIKVEFTQEWRGWAVDFPEQADAFTGYAVDWAGDAGYDSYDADGTSPGYLAGLELNGEFTLQESEILDAGSIRVELARDFGELRGGDHVLVMDNRQRQWLPGAENFTFLGLPWEEKRLTLYHGWELPDGEVEWLLVYQGAIERLSGMGDAWEGRHRASLESQDWITTRLGRAVGAPAADGMRQPFMRGTYRASAELVETTPAVLGTPMKSGGGSATLRVVGTYRGDTHLTYRVTAESSGEIGAATFKWSNNNGQSWKETGIVCTGAEDPVKLEEGLSVYFEAGIGTDLVAGDSWAFAAQAPVYHYQIYGFPFESITAVYLNGEETWDQVTAEPQTGAITVTGRSATVEARVVKDATTHPVDIITDIFAEVGLTQAIDQEAFDLAKSLTPEYAVGVCFENIPAAAALREILSRTLYDLWTDFGMITLRAYLGD